jgi:hypothetical protein
MLDLAPLEAVESARLALRYASRRALARAEDGTGRALLTACITMEAIAILVRAGDCDPTIAADFADAGLRLAGSIR